MKSLGECYTMKYIVNVCPGTRHVITIEELQLMKTSVYDKLTQMSGFRKILA